MGVLQELKQEGVESPDISFTDNSGLLELFMGSPLGMFNLVDEQSRFPNADDQSLIDKLNSQLGKYKKVRFSRLSVLAWRVLADV